MNDSDLYRQHDDVIFVRDGHRQSSRSASISRIYPGEGEEPIRFGLLFDGDRLMGPNTDKPQFHDPYALAAEITPQSGGGRCEAFLLRFIAKRGEVSVAELEAFSARHELAFGEAAAYDDPVPMDKVLAGMVEQELITRDGQMVTFVEQFDDKPGVWDHPVELG